MRNKCLFVCVYNPHKRFTSAACAKKDPPPHGDIAVPVPECPHCPNKIVAVHLKMNNVTHPGVGYVLQSRCVGPTRAVETFTFIDHSSSCMH